MIKRMLVLLAVAGVCIHLPLLVWGDQPLQWSTPVGDFNLNLTATQALLGYDAVLKQAIGGMSVPVYTDPKGIVTLQLGAGAPWPTNGATVEPLFLAGHNILKEIPGLNQYQNASLNIFGRYASNNGKAGAGIAFSYAFGGGSVSPPSVAPVP